MRRNVNLSVKTQEEKGSLTVMRRGATAEAHCSAPTRRAPRWWEAQYMARSGTSASSAADFNRTLSAGYTVGLVCKTTPMFPGSGGGQMCASPHSSVPPQCRKHRVGRPAREVLAVGTGASPTVRSASGVRGVLGGELDRLGPGRSIEQVERGLLSREDPRRPARRHLG